MEFGLRLGDISFFVFYKFEIVIFKIVQVMTENIPFCVSLCTGYINSQTLYTLDLLSEEIVYLLLSMTT